MCQHRRFAQLIALRQREQGVVGDAVPEEERQPRGEIEIVDAIAHAGRGRRLALDAEQKVEADEHPLDGRLHAGLEAACFRRSVEEAEQRLHLLGCGWPTVGTAREPRQNSPRAAGLFSRNGRPTFAKASTAAKAPADRTAGKPAREDEPAARRIAGTRTAVRAIDRQRVNGGKAIEVLVGAASEIHGQRLRHAFGLPRSINERRTHDMHAGAHLRPHLESRIGGV